VGILLWEAGILCHEWEQEAEEGLLKHGAGERYSQRTITQNKHVSCFMPVMLQAKANCTVGSSHQSLAANPSLTLWHVDCFFFLFIILSM